MSDSDTWVGDAIVDYVKECSARSIQLAAVETAEALRVRTSGGDA